MKALSDMAWPPPPNTTRVLLVRHGETDWNKNRRYQGHTDIPLNQTGIQQAHALQRRLDIIAKQNNMDCLFCQSISSSLSRAHDTAKALTPKHIPITLESRFWERNYGQLAGLTSQEMERKHPDDFKAIANRQPDASITGGEKLGHFYSRIINVFSELTETHRHKTILMVAHGGVLDCIYRHITQKPLETQRDWPIPNTGLNVIDILPGQKYIIQAWGDNTHTQELKHENLDELDGRVT